MEMSIGAWSYSCTHLGANEVWYHALGVRARLNSHSSDGETVAVLVIRTTDCRLSGGR